MVVILFLKWVFFFFKNESLLGALGIQASAYLKSVKWDHGFAIVPVEKA